MSKPRTTRGMWEARGIKPHFIEDGVVDIDLDAPYAHWVVAAINRDDQGRRVTTHLAKVHRCGLMPDEEMAANAHLIAAAPELYAALDRLCKDGLLTGLDQEAGWDSFFSQGRAALAKARGEAS